MKTWLHFYHLHLHLHLHLHHTVHNPSPFALNYTLLFLYESPHPLFSKPPLVFPSLSLSLPAQSQFQCTPPHRHPPNNSLLTTPICSGTGRHRVRFSRTRSNRLWERVTVMGNSSTSSSTRESRSTRSPSRLSPRWASLRTRCRCSDPTAWTTMMGWIWIPQRPRLQRLPWFATAALQLASLITSPPKSVRRRFPLHLNFHFFLV